MKTLKLTVVTDNFAQTYTFRYRHLFVRDRRFLFYNCEDKPTGEDAPDEVFDVSINHSFALEYL